MLSIRHEQGCAIQLTLFGVTSLAGALDRVFQSDWLTSGEHSVALSCPSGPCRGLLPRLVGLVGSGVVLAPLEIVAWTLVHSIGIWFQIEPAPVAQLVVWLEGVSARRWRSGWRRRCRAFLRLLLRPRSSRRGRFILSLGALGSLVLGTWVWGALVLRNKNWVSLQSALYRGAYILESLDQVVYLLVCEVSSCLSEVVRRHVPGLHWSLNGLATILHSKGLEDILGELSL